MFARQKYGQHCSDRFKINIALYSLRQIIETNSQGTVQDHCRAQYGAYNRVTKNQDFELKKPLLCIDYDAVNVENDASNLLTASHSTS